MTLTQPTRLPHQHPLISKVEQGLSSIASLFGDGDGDGIHETVTGHNKAPDGTEPTKTPVNSSNQEDNSPQLADAAAGAGSGACNPGGTGRPQRGSLKEGDVGSYDYLKKAGAEYDDLTPHHIPQAAMGFTPYKEGAAIALSTADRKNTRTFGSAGGKTKVQGAGCKPFIPRDPGFGL